MQTPYRQELIDKAMYMYSFLKHYPDAPADIIFLYVNEWKFRRNEMEEYSILSNFLYMWDFKEKLPKDLRLKLFSEIKAGKDNEKKIQALMKLYKD
jgi:hypothetical protein